MSFFGSVTHALNPVNQIKAAYNVAKNPLDPFAQTRAMANLFTGGGGKAPPQQPPGYGPPWAQQQQYPPPDYMPPGAYAPPQQQPYYPPPPPPMPGPSWASPPPPMQPWAPPPMFDYAAPFDPAQYGGSSTGWDAAYGSGAGW